MKKKNYEKKIKEKFYEQPFFYLFRVKVTNDSRR